LAEAYTELRSKGAKFEIIFVSNDYDAESFQSYFQDMPWLALDYAARDTEAKFSKGFRVRGIPTLILMNPQTGEMQEDGRECVGLGSDFYPWTAELKV
jgi:nucleoredoxin